MAGVKLYLCHLFLLFAGALLRRQSLFLRLYQLPQWSRCAICANRIQVHNNQAGDSAREKAAHRWQEGLGG